MGRSRSSCRMPVIASTSGREAWRRGRACIAFMAVVLAVAMPGLSARQLLDRVVARVDGFAITLTDVRAAVALGIVDVPPDGGVEEAVRQLVNRQLMRAEVVRFAPAEPPVADVNREVEALMARVGGRFTEFTAETGLDEAQIHAIARDTLRIRAYLDQRFGTAAQLTEEDVLQYYRIHPEEFTRQGGLIPFGDAEPDARARAAAARRGASVAQWLQDLRRRADLVIVGASGP